MKHKLWITIATYIAYCINKELYKAIEYLKAQVEVLIEQQEKDKRILLDNHQRIRLVLKAKQLTRKLFEETTVLFTPDTILSWYRKLIAQKYDGSKNAKNSGRPKISTKIDPPKQNIGDGPPFKAGFYTVFQVGNIVRVFVGT